MSRVCVNSPDKFCYICGEIILKNLQKKITEPIKEAYEKYFNCKLLDQDKERAPHVVCNKCTKNLRKWRKTGKKTIQFDVPMMRQEESTFSWEKVYEEELENFKGHGDVGEIWFGRKNTLKATRWISTELKLDKSAKIIDIGCGNAITLLELAKIGYENLTGVDYSEKAINLAREILKKDHLPFIKLTVCDILNLEDVKLLNNFKLAHDKGTYDAISLNPENAAEKRRKYVENVHKILSEDGCLFLTKCNWTKEEIETHFANYFDVSQVLPTDAFIFGGQSGNTVTQLVLRKKCFDK